MSSEFGKNLHVSIFGESHGPAIGVVVNGFPAGEKVDTDALLRFMARRAPGNSRLTTARKMQSPERTVFQGDTADVQIFHIFKTYQLRTELFRIVKHEMFLAVSAAVGIVVKKAH